MVNTNDWMDLLTQWNSAIWDSTLVQQHQHLITPEMRATGWLGAPAAKADQIARVESRLGVALPPSYRTFLSVANGWSVLSFFAGQIWSTEDVGWLRDNDPETIEIWAEEEVDVPDAEYFVYGKGQDRQNLRTRYFHTALQISNPRYRDGECYLLNPQVVTPEGEWEAWFFASWLPGASRYRSFWDLMQDEYADFLRLKERRRTRR